VSGRRGGPWAGVAVVAAVGATAIDCVLLQGKYRLFTGGFLRPYHLEGGAIPAFFGLSLWLDGAAACLFVPLALVATRGLRTRARRLFAAAGLSLAPLLACSVARFEVDRFAGDWVGYTLASGADVPRWLATLGLAAVAVAGGGAVVWLARFVPDAAVRPLLRGTRRPWLLGAAWVVSAPVVLALAGAAWKPGQDQLVLKTSGAWALAAGSAATDFDGDGYGLVRAPADAAPFDARRHPFAIDRPGNGVDENGLGGDLAAPGDFARERHGPAEFARRPDVVLFVLESYRADNLKARVDGRPVAPVLRGLVADGAVTGPAFSHNGYTIPSLTHLFKGGLTAAAEGSLVDDFGANGYVTACVSGEDESFGGIARRTGMDRADVFVDARADKGRRVSAFTTPGSLTVPWPVVVGHVEALLDARRGDGRPLFAYVNFQDCHFPYQHREMESIFPAEPLSRAAITARNAGRVRRLYRNAAANVDRAVGRVLAAWERARGRAPAVVAVADHGENLFEDGLLGHGTVVNGTQMRILFLVHGLDAECVFPLGLRDVRSLVRDALARPDPPPAPRVDPDRWVFLYTGPLRSPQKLGAGFARGGVAYDLADGAWSSWGEPPRRPPVITLWEQIRLFDATR